jgi:putative tricarboxylic transport membrane protein
MIASLAPAALAAFPDRPLEFVACYGPGGGHDTLLRTMSRTLTESGIVSQPINVVNKPGGSGAVGMGYVNSHAGSDYYLMSTTSSFIATPLKGGLKVNYEDFTPIALLGLDPEVIVAHKSSGWTTLKEAMESGKELNIAGAGTGSLDSIVCLTLQKLSGKELNYIPYQGDGAIVAALLGQQVELAVANMSTIYDYVKTGDFIPLAISTPKRVPMMADIPTMVEQGYDITLSLFRGIVAPKDISAEAKAFYIDMIKKMVQVPSWQENYIQQNLIVNAPLYGDDYGKFLAETNAIYSGTLKELGVIK